MATLVNFVVCFSFFFRARSIVIVFVSSDVKIARLFLVLISSAVNSWSSLILINTIESCWPPCASLLLTWLSPPQRLPLGIPYENNNNRKNRKRAGDDGKREWREPLFSLPTSNGSPRALFFFLPSLPTTQRGLCGEESWPGELQCLTSRVYYTGNATVTYPFHIPILEHCVPFSCCKCTVFIIWLNH